MTGVQTCALPILGLLIIDEEQRFGVRHKERIKLSNNQLIRAMIGILLIFIVPEAIWFNMNSTQFFVMSAGTFAVMSALLFFKPISYPSLTTALPRPLVTLIQLMGRRTLEIYVIHLTLFKFIGMWISPDRFPSLSLMWLWTLIT